MLRHTEQDDNHNHINKLLGRVVAPADKSMLKELNHGAAI